MPLYIDLSSPHDTSCVEPAMYPYFLNFTPSIARAVSALALPFEWLQEAEDDRLPVRADRLRGWPLLVAILVLLGMLLAFHQVVRGGLQLSELRHRAMAVHAKAIWHCNSLQGRDVSDRCLLQAQADARRVALAQFKDTP